MKRAAAAAALALIVGLAGPASALPQANNWIIGQWSCRLGGQNVSMTWRYPIVACADNCSSDPAAARPDGTFRGIHLAYVSGDANQFSYRQPPSFSRPLGLVVHMNRIGRSPDIMQGPYPGSSVGLRCTKSASPRLSLPY